MSERQTPERSDQKTEQLGAGIDGGSNEKSAAKIEHRTPGGGIPK
jgi:hypothetical protein